MNKVFFLLLMLSMFGCTTLTEKTESTVEKDLYGRIDEYKKLEEYKACVLLGELALSENIIKDLRARVSGSPRKNICQYYLLAKRSGKQSDIDKYIEVFPRGEQQNWIWETHFDAGFPVRFSSPYFVFLADQARFAKNNLALEILISGMPYADGSEAETLVGVLANIYSVYPDWVINELKKNNIQERTVKLIVETSKYENQGK